MQHISYFSFSTSIHNIHSFFTNNIIQSNAFHDYKSCKRGQQQPPTHLTPRHYHNELLVQKDHQCVHCVVAMWLVPSMIFNCSRLNPRKLKGGHIERPKKQPVRFETRESLHTSAIVGKKVVELFLRLKFLNGKESMI